MPGSYHGYILASMKNGTLYIGMTNDIARRITEHRAGKRSTFTGRYAVYRLVHIESFATPAEAIAREKALKKWSRPWKTELIERDNPGWRDLFKDINT